MNTVHRGIGNNPTQVLSMGLCLLFIFVALTCGALSLSGSYGGHSCFRYYEWWEQLGIPRLAVSDMTTPDPTFTSSLVMLWLSTACFFYSGYRRAKRHMTPEKIESRYILGFLLWSSCYYLTFLGATFRGVFLAES